MLGIYRTAPALTANALPLVAIKAPVLCSFGIDLFPWVVWRKGYVKDRVGAQLAGWGLRNLGMSDYLSSEIAGRLRRILGWNWVLSLEERRRTNPVLMGVSLVQQDCLVSPLRRLRQGGNINALFLTLM